MLYFVEFVLVSFLKRLEIRLCWHTINRGIFHKQKLTWTKLLRLWYKSKLKVINSQEEINVTETKILVSHWDRHIYMRSCMIGRRLLGETGIWRNLMSEMLNGIKETACKTITKRTSSNRTRTFNYSSFPDLQAKISLAVSSGDWKGKLGDSCPQVRGSSHGDGRNNVGETKSAFMQSLKTQ